MSDDSANFGLLMPFVTVESKGGAYNDDSYCAGWEASSFAALMVDINKADLPPCDIHLSLPVRSANLQQLDLIAMNAGWIVRTTGPLDPDAFWSYIMLTRVSDGGPAPPPGEG